MREKKLVIRIDKPASFVFEFTLNPKNTPKWLGSIVKEETNEWPPKLGTIYRNGNREEKWDEYKLTEFVENKMFVMTSKDGNYNVRYKLTPVDENTTDLEYYEWVNEGELENPFTLEILQKLKKLIEG